MDERDSSNEQPEYPAAAPSAPSAPLYSPPAAYYVPPAANYGPPAANYAPQYSYYPPGPDPQAFPVTAPVIPTASRRRRVLFGTGIAAAVAAICITGIVATSSSIVVSGAGTSLSAGTQQAVDGGSQSGTGGTGGGTGTSGGTSGDDGSGTGDQSTTGGATSTGTATESQQVGVVDIDTVLKYENAKAAGTGLVLTSNGEILTNNHVVEGATSITVTVVSTGKTYTATVVGTDPTEDIAVLQLTDASGLKTAKISTTATVSVGDAVTAVGNAGGVGGTPSSASGTVTALNQAITASDESGANPENLVGLIESNAPIQAGDSGGPLYNAKDEVIGIDTAGSSSSATLAGSGATQAYAIPIATAVAIAAKIESGKETDVIHIGYPAFLGIQLSSGTPSRRGGTPDGTTGGTATAGAAVIAGVVDGTPAATAGLVAGDTITSVGSSAIATSSDLSAALAGYEPGQSVKIGWTDAAGAAHTATVTLIQGAAD
jgi:S1-C subfamily serine protease